ncbi:MAG: CPBP family intramembrane metalloprotease [Paludibacteraceae bacterium]|nr:CPBP family intramembrane metalloprotease [Paludibacteraceae bacterium]
MKLDPTKRRWVAIALFYVIAVLTRALALKYQDLNTGTFIVWLWNWARGIGPCLGAIVAVLVFKREFYCSVTGTSVWKSAVSVLLPFAICFFFDCGLSFTLLGFIFYSFLEEVGWRGYLQGELKDMNPVLRVLIIGLMWFFWHIYINFSIGGLIFLAVLLLGTWGIGCIARDTKSLAACACFHTLFNFSNQSGISFSPTVISLYVLVIVGWFLIWYVPWGKLSSRKG